MDKINSISKDIIDNYPRLGLDDTFSFSCNPSVPCFGACCHDINIFLTPYDVLRLKKNLGITSEEFIAKYALSPEINTETRIPLVVLRMSDAEGRPCQFLGEKGCTVYEDRPWSCRMYPLGLASQRSKYNPTGEEFYYLMVEHEKCKGHGIGGEIRVGDYLESQKVADFDSMNEMYKGLTLHPFFSTEQTLSPHQLQMFYMAAYNLDMFRRFLTNSKFFEIMVTPEGSKELIENNDDELLKFSMLWLHYILFGEGPIRVKPEIVAARREEYTKAAMEEQRKKDLEAREKSGDESK
jgi:Fe-S-cluster containining protein